MAFAKVNYNIWLAPICTANSMLFFDLLNISEIFAEKSFFGMLPNPLQLCLFLLKVSQIEKIRKKKATIINFACKLGLKMHVKWMPYTIILIRSKNWIINFKVFVEENCVHLFIISRLLCYSFFGCIVFNCFILFILAFFA